MGDGPPSEGARSSHIPANRVRVSRPIPVLPG
jgi:hypothetical protein